MPPGKTDLSIYQGDDYLLHASFTAGGVPLDLTGHSFRAQIRPTTADDDAGAAALAEFEVTVTDPAGGELDLELAHTVTTDLSGKAHWDLEGTDPAGKVTTYLAGVVVVTDEVTR